MAAAATDRSQLMFLGSSCHHQACHLNDFLPFKCPACSETFCQPHFLPSQHDCAAPLPPSMIDRVAPQCPLCNSTVPTVPNDPNLAVERHILSGTCTGIPGGEQRLKDEMRRKKERGEVCWRKGCSKHLVVPMRCEQCSHLFCPTHRHASSHTCTPSASPSSSRGGTPQPSKPAGKSALSRLLSTTPSSSNPSSQPSSSTSKPPPASPVQPVQASTSPLDAKAAAATAALKRAGQDVKVPFVKSKTEKRANAEMNSQLQALKNRHDKGLLSKQEEVRG
ncbi:hypothetical protein BD324DRAFT_639702 [Kockovaella imperatae]|uniref:AN1-type domain-containing protein n=1 Tax=Kockovaella imperatae TaxID=4999 RepID=A0A1Y1U5V1_9TREE|nr:hypothetical protein BD324DRAFT_639702 [Kockovaella imperatae]ORX33413.1 hypothetical protein BD324DRAFT_639702 [Kockovaella imperatae]